jgi:hypothetical protein
MIVDATAIYCVVFAGITEKFLFVLLYIFVLFSKLTWS